MVRILRPEMVQPHSSDPEVILPPQIVEEPLDYAQGLNNLLQAYILIAQESWTRALASSDLEGDTQGNAVVEPLTPSQAVSADGASPPSLSPFNGKRDGETSGQATKKSIEALRTLAEE